jgi:hypothetical protein
MRQQLTNYRFNPPPGWPSPPPGWVPPAGWRPDTSWPAAPAGWRYWVAAGQREIAAAGTTDAPTSGHGSSSLTTGQPVGGPALPAALSKWTPTSLDRPSSPRDWRFSPPPGWPIPPGLWIPPVGWRPDPTWPAPPTGWTFWTERWHAWLAVGSLITGVLGIALVAQGRLPEVLFGLLVLAAVVAAGRVSRFWFHDKILPMEHRLLIWVVAVPGLVSGICFLWIFKVTDVLIRFFSRPFY